LDASSWLSSQEPQKLLEWLSANGRLTERKARLFAGACCRRVWRLLRDERSHQAIEVAERYADGLTSDEDLAKALGLAWQAYHGFEELWVRSPRSAEDAGFHDRMLAAEAVGWLTQDEDPRVPQPIRVALSRLELVLPVVVETTRLTRVAVGRHSQNRAAAEQAGQLALLRDIFNNPCRPLTIEPSLLTSNGGLIRQLAQAAYDNRILPAGTLDPARVAVLCDGVEECGLSSPELLSHLRGGLHLRGCHAIDALLGRS
jgi:hypothetical protein